MKTDHIGLYNDRVTIAQAKQFWTEWYSRVVGATVLGLEIIDTDEHGWTPVLTVRLPDGTCWSVPVHEDPEGVIGTTRAGTP